ncbi:SPX domain-containing protein [Mycena sanguinolenta]|uniref:SPX domain-containing protein n=1 Tax=Mycena sanguinolenta TaxID=230812 RepID=A0A8H7DNV1_9AGAR|nr:SPX domain-containing protein [Mycena sanguinolenta]
MSPPAPVYTVFLRRSLRRPALIFVVLLVIFLGQFMREMGFDAHCLQVRRCRYGAREGDDYTHAYALGDAYFDAYGGGVADARGEAGGSRKPKGTRRRIQSRKRTKKKINTHSTLPACSTSIPSLHTPFPSSSPAPNPLGRKKLSRASATLRAAISEYRRRCNRLPPRGFDAWWAYAKVHGVMLPDEYDAIEKDLGPFWGVEPSVLREVQRG